MRYTLFDIFSFMQDRLETSPSQDVGGLFAGETGGHIQRELYSEEEVKFVSAFLSAGKPDFEYLGPQASRLFELSASAFFAILHAWMSEMPIEGKIAKYARKVISAGSRGAAEKAASDRGDADTLAVLLADYKVRHEINRLKGFLRFSLREAPPERGVWTAFCRPDHFSLPALAGHFNARFGELPWEITDEKRHLRLQGPVFKIESAPCPQREAQGGQWEDLWGHYHKTISIESRKNLNLQNKFIPARYRKNMNEL